MYYFENASHPLFTLKYDYLDTKKQDSKNCPGKAAKADLTRFSRFDKI